VLNFDEDNDGAELEAITETSAIGCSIPKDGTGVIFGTSDFEDSDESNLDCEV